MNKRMTRHAVLFIEVSLLIMGYSAVDVQTAASYEQSLAAPPVENASVETPGPHDADMPAHWSNNAWGDLTATFTYLNEGYSGSRSVKTEVVDYKDGDAKWFFNPIKLAPGDYRFGDYYRADVETSVVAAVTMVSGDIKYIDMPDAPPSAAWTKYEATFTMPRCAESVTVYHLLSHNGYLIADDYCIRPYQYEGFDRGLVTISFDDGWEDNIATALPIMHAFGYKSNQYYATTYIEHSWVSNPKERIMLFVDDGHEIGSHSVTHPDLTALASQQITDELAGSKSFLEDYLGIRIAYFATPYGSYNTAVNEEIMTYYAAHRTVDRGYNSRDNFDASRLKCQSVLSSTTAAQVSEWVNKAREEKLWLILLYHKVTDHPGKYDTNPESFYEHMQVIKSAGIPVVTMSKALAELQPQAPGSGMNIRIEYIIGFAASSFAVFMMLFIKTRIRRYSL